MIPSPARDDSQRWTEPTIAFINGTAIIPAPRRVSFPRSLFGIASSTRARINNDGTTDSTEMTKIVASTPPSIHAYGRP